jgi:hypothetical protein
MSRAQFRGHLFRRCVVDEIRKLAALELRYAADAISDMATAI